MPNYCVVCRKTTRTEDGSERSLFRFPKNSEELRLWLKNLHKDFVPTPYNRLCSDHFSEDCLQRTATGHVLKSGAVPTIFQTATCIFCNTSKLLHPHLTFHEFPVNPKTTEKWFTAVNGTGMKVTITADSVLCSRHFDRSCFRSTSCRRLKDSAVPTIFTINEIQDETNDMEVDKENADCNVIERVSVEEIDANRLSSGDQCPGGVEVNNTIHEVADNTNLCNHDVGASRSEEVLDVSTTEPTMQDTPKRQCLDSSSRSSSSALTFHDHHYERSPKALSKVVANLQRRNAQLQVSLKCEKQKVSRLRKTVLSMKDIIAELRSDRAITDSGLASLEATADTDVSEFLKRYANNIKKSVLLDSEANDKKTISEKCVSRVQYPPALRSFAMTLHFYSPKAYMHVRSKFCNALPDPRTIRSWFSSVDCQPGFTTESFFALKIKVSQQKEKGKEVLASFMLDEMGIKKGFVCLPNGEIKGYVDVGSNVEKPGSTMLAKDALVLMVVSVDERWKIPVAYFLISGIDAETTAGLIQDGLIRLHEVAMKVISVTLDGPSQHFATMKSLGCSFCLEKMQPFFPHPSTKHKVYVIFDACHMLKLARNCLGDVQALKDADGNFILWNYIQLLVVLQNKEGLRAGNKLRSAHLQYSKMKMKVALAAQTLSSSVADAIEFCSQDLKLPEFQGSEGTVRFIRCIDTLFDFMNSRNPFAKGSKSPLRASTEQYWRPIIEREVEYLKGITNSQGKSIFKTKRRVAFIGFVNGVVATLAIFDEYVKPPNSQIQYLLTYKLSQDHLELFFCAIRSCGGWCPNPTSSQFESAYKKLLVRHEISSTNGNVEAMDSTSILTASSGISKNRKVDVYDQSVYEKIDNIRVAKKYSLDDGSDNHDDNEFMNEFLQFHSKLPESLSDFSVNCIAHVSGWVVKRLIHPKMPIVKCDKCREALFGDNGIHSQTMENLLICSKTRGGLIVPSDSVVRLCKRTEELYRRALNSNNGKPISEKNFPAVLCNAVLRDVYSSPCTLFPSLYTHVFDGTAEEISNHIYTLSKNVIKVYLRVRIFASTKVASQSEVGTKLRHHMTRQLVWIHQ